MKQTKKFTPMAIAIAQLIGINAYAADAQLPEVEVVANTIVGTGVPLSQTPSNAQTLKAKDITEQGTNNLADLLNNNLGSVSVSNGTGNGYQNDVNYRGFSATSLLGAPVGLSVYFDGVRMNEPFGSIVNWDLIPMNAISSINVLPGSNPMFGLNTLGGALVLDTKNGKDNQGTSFKILGGSFNRRGISAETGWVDKERNADFFIAGNYDKQDGYRDHSGSEIKQLFGKARWRGQSTSAELSFAFAESNLSGTQSLPLSMLSNPKSAYTWPDTISNNMALINLELSHEINQTNSVSGNLYYRRSNAANLNSNVAYDDGCSSTNGVNQCYQSVSNGTAANAVSSNPYGLARYTGDINTVMVQSNTHQDTYGTNFQVTNTNKLVGKENALTLGGIVEVSKITYNQDTTLAQLVNYQTIITPNLRYYFPSTSSTSGTNLIKNVNMGSNTFNYSIFLTDTIEVNEKFSVTASGSYNWTILNQAGATNQYLNDDGGYSWTSAADGTTRYYNANFVGAQYYSGSTLKTIGLTPGTNIAVATGNPGPERSSLDGKHSYSRFNPALGFNFNPSKNIGFFGGYSESMRAPTSVELSCANPNSPCSLPTGFNGDPDLKAVIARTYELGARGRLAGNTLWSFAVYDTKLSNDIQFVTANSTTGYFANVGDTERRGFEGGIGGKYNKLFLGANYGYVDARYKSAWSSLNGDVVSGNKIPGIPNQTLKIRAAYDVTSKLLVGTNLILVSGQYAHGDEVNQQIKVPGYGVMNLDVRYKLNDELSLFALANNVLNKTYSTYGVMGTNIYNGQNEQFRTPAAGRAVWVGLTYTFGGKRLNKIDKD